MYCPKCGAQNQDGSRFCRSCGESLPATSGVGGSAPVEGKPVKSSGQGSQGKGHKTRTIAVIVAIVVVVIVVLAVFVIPSMTKKSDTASVSETVSAQTAESGSTGIEASTTIKDLQVTVTNVKLDAENPYGYPVTYTLRNDTDQDRKVTLQVACDVTYLDSYGTTQTKHVDLECNESTINSQILAHSEKSCVVFLSYNSNSLSNFKTFEAFGNVSVTVTDAKIINGNDQLIASGDYTLSADSFPYTDKGNAMTITNNSSKRWSTVDVYYQIYDGNGNVTPSYGTKSGKLVEIGATSALESDFSNSNVNSGSFGKSTYKPASDTGATAKLIGVEVQYGTA